MNQEPDKKSSIPSGDARSNRVDSSKERWGLLATGSSRLWHIDVEESLDVDEWVMAIDGPQAYLVFLLDNLRALEEALQLLEAGPPSGEVEKRNNGSPVTLGRFGPAPVSLVWDNENFPRCFLTVGPQPRATLRVTFDGEDIEMFTQALRQVVQDLPRVSAKQGQQIDRG